MSKKKTKGRSGVGTFFFGSFIGFILCIALIVGAGFFAYYKVSADWINKTFKTELDLGNDEINNKTIGELITGAVGIVQNLDTYTLENLKKDFGIEVKDELMGIKINDLKTVSLQDLPDAIEKKFGSISADELRNVNGMNLEKEMGDILKKTNKYYFNASNQKLYNTINKATTPYEYSEEVTFDYEVKSLGESSYEIITKDNATSVVDGEVAIELWYLPLTSAIGDFTSNLGSNLTLKELDQDYNVDLPDYILKDENLDKTINEFEDIIKTLKICDVLGYCYDEADEFYFEDKNGNGTYQDGEDSKITGIMATLAGLKVSEISNKVNTLKIGDALGYYYDETDQKFYKDSSKTQITGILSAFVDLTIQDLNESTLKTQVNKLTIADVFDNTSSGMLSLIPSTTKLGDITSVMNERMKTVTLGEFIDNEVIELSDDASVQYDAIKDKPITDGDGATVKVSELKVVYVMELTIANLYNLLIGATL